MSLHAGLRVAQHEARSSEGERDGVAALAGAPGLAGAPAEAGSRSGRRPTGWTVRVHAAPGSPQGTTGTWLQALLAALDLCGLRLPALEVELGADGWAVGRVGGEALWRIRLPETRALSTLLGQCTATALHLADRLFLHAGVVAVRGRAVVLAGPSGAGKTSLVAALLAQGATYLSDEVAWFPLPDGVPNSVQVPDGVRAPDRVQSRHDGGPFKGAPCAFPFALPLAIKPWTLRALGTLPSGEVVARDDDVTYVLPPRRAPTRVPVALLVLLEGRGRRVRLRSLSPGAVFLALSRQPSSLQLARHRARAFAGLADLLRTVPAVGLAAPSPAAGAAALLEALP